jgi:effector-binding domain-containing protein
VRDGRTDHAHLAATIRDLLDDVWSHLRSRSDVRPGHSIVLYRGDPSQGPIDVEIGVQVDEPLPVSAANGPGSEVRASELPGGRAARIVHVGPYDQLARTYDTLAKWARDEGHTLSGPSWEVYGDWTDDTSKLETEIYFRLA